jgi:heme exporter protein CcmD
MFVLFVSLLSVFLGSLLGKYASYILGAMGIALLLMLIEPVQLMLKRRSVLQDIKRIKRLEQRTKSEQQPR